MARDETAAVAAYKRSMLVGVRRLRSSVWLAARRTRAQRAAELARAQG